MEGGIGLALELRVILTGTDDAGVVEALQLGDDVGVIGAGG